MATPDCKAPTLVRLSPAARRFSVRVSLCISSFLVFSSVLINAETCRAQDQQAQDVAEAAKQERARKQAQQKKSNHVYTEEDLKRAQILTPEDRAQLEAARNQPVPPAKENLQPAADASAVASEAADPTVAPKVDAPLGDVARFFRQLKLSHALQRSAEFHLPLGEAPVLASPKPPLQPLRPPFSVKEPAPPSPDFRVAPPSPKLKANSPRLAPLPPSLSSVRPWSPVLQPTHPRFAPSQPIVKRSPFARPPAIAFAPSRVQPSQPLTAPAAPPLAPTVRVAPAPSTAAPIVKPRPASPKISSRPISPATPRPAAPLVPAASVKLTVITVQPGDSLWKIAAQNLGQGLRWHALLAINPGILDPNHIVAGTQLYLPAAPRRMATTFTVRPGDTLSQIAQSQLGRASYAACIAQANPTLRDINRIFPGQSLLLPASCNR